MTLLRPHAVNETLKRSRDSRTVMARYENSITNCRKLDSVRIKTQSEFVECNQIFQLHSLCKKGLNLHKDFVKNVIYNIHCFFSLQKYILPTPWLPP